jgi:hypothetical protein
VLVTTNMDKGLIAARRAECASAGNGPWCSCGVPTIVVLHSVDTCPLEGRAGELERSLAELTPARALQERI